MGRQRASLQLNPRLQSLGGWALSYELPMIVLKQISKDWGGGYQEGNEGLPSGRPRLLIEARHGAGVGCGAARDRASIAQGCVTSGA